MSRLKYLGKRFTHVVITDVTAVVPVVTTGEEVAELDEAKSS